jgi:luciferase family oxidoreductase group 1
MIPLSVLDLSVVTTGTRPAAALQNSIDLARHVDGLGYVRYWLAEHHNLASVASPAPDLMIGQIAAVTKNIRVGSGGVMLPNHAPLVVAERFKMLEALFPAVSISASRPVPMAPPRTRCAAGSIAAKATIFSNA